MRADGVFALVVEIMIRLERNEAFEDRSPGDAQIPKICRRKVRLIVTWMVRGRPQLSRRRYEPFKRLEVREAQREAVNKMFWMAHDARVVGVVGVIKDVAAAIAPFAQ